MSPYSIPYPTHRPATAGNGIPLHANAKNGRNGHRTGTASRSSSEEGYPQYDVHKIDTDPEEDPNAGLTAQTLNADGTPKRPMNAFMIFARRRRPQVSAENQSMRTGEISKILSREWNTMGSIEKQFYLEQAKQLKEVFNNKYPDYVYRRRPNNSRRRRRPEAGVNPSLDNSLPSEHPGDISGSDTHGDHSPLEGEEGAANHGVDVAYARIAHDAQHGYGEHSPYPASQPRPSAYIYPTSEIPYRGVDPHDTRANYMSAHDPLAREVHPPLTNGAARLVEAHCSPYMSSPTHSQPSPQYPPEHTTSHWEHKSDIGRTTWVANHDRTLPTSKTLPFPSASSPATSWTSTATPTQISPTSATAPNGSNYPFPTLNSPFYPNPSTMASNFTSSSPSSASASQYSSPGSQIQGGAPASRHSQHYETASYTASRSIPSLNGFAHPSQRDSHLYQQSPQTRSALPRPLPPLQPLSAFSQASPVHTAPSPSIGYWSRGSIDG